MLEYDIPYSHSPYTVCPKPHLEDKIGEACKRAIFDSSKRISKKPIQRWKKGLLK